MSWPGEVSEKDGVRSPPRCSVTLILSDTSFQVAQQGLQPGRGVAVVQERGDVDGAHGLQACSCVFRLASSMANVSVEE